MQLKIPSSWSWFIVSIAGIVFSATVFLFLIPDMSGQDSRTKLDSRAGGQVLQAILPTDQASVGLPIRFRIPKIKINAAIEYVGLTNDGAMDVPKGSANVAWLRIGKRPGEKGSAVIAGHFGWKEGIPAVFDNLHTLRAGDRIYVEDERGAVTTFVVRELRRYGEYADASDVFGSSDGKSHLNLITCEGVWDAVSKSYSKRLVVFTDGLR